MNYEYLTRKHFIDVLKGFGIQNGDLICLQANLSRFGNVIDGYRSLLEACQEVIGKEGCIMIPTFTYSAYDPACVASRRFDFEKWQDVREEMKGYSQKYSASEIYPECASQFMRYDYKRSNHPIYNFAFWGTYEEGNLKQQMNYPLSFSHVLNGFVKRRAFNIVIGDDILNSVLIPAIGKTMNAGVSKIERAYVSSTNKKILKTYLNLDMTKNQKEKMLEMCFVQKTVLNSQEIHCVSIVNNK